MAKKPPSQRQLKVGEMLRHHLSNAFLQGAVYHETLEGVSTTVSEVRISPDLRNATVFVSPLGANVDTKAYSEALEELVPQLRHYVAQRAYVRHCPQLCFRLDETFQEASHMEALFSRIEDDLAISEEHVNEPV